MLTFSKNISPIVNKTINFKNHTMKLHVKLSIFLFMFTLFSCGDDDSSNVAEVEISKLSVLINGSEFNAEFISGTIVSSGSKILVSGSSTAETEIPLIFPISASEGESFTVASGEFFGAIDDGKFQGNVAEEGSITITFHDTSKQIVKGIFNFSTFPNPENRNVYKLTQGEFEVSYSEL